MYFNKWLKEEEFDLFNEYLLNDSLKGIAQGVLGAGRGVLGAGKAAFRTLDGAMTVGDELLSKMVGQGTKGRMRSGLNNFAGGVRDFVVGPKPSVKPTDQQPKQTKTNQVQTAQPLQQQPQTSQTKSVSPNVGFMPPYFANTWDELAQSYKVAKTRQEKDAIQKKLAILDPIKYQQALKKAEKMRLRSSAMGRK